MNWKNILDNIKKIIKKNSAKRDLAVFAVIASGMH